MRPGYKPQAKLNIVDRVVGYFNPDKLMRRAAARAKYSTAVEQGYVIPGSQKKTMKGVVATANSPTTDLAGKLPGVRAISRDMAMNSPLAVSIPTRIATNVLGAGLQPQLMPNTKILGITEEEAQEFTAQVEAGFDAWASSKESDYVGLHDFFDQQGLALISTMLNGDLFYTLPWRNGSKKKGLELGVTGTTYRGGPM